ncbi:MAG: right-handed parallel beta-helix repeat-containing protein, partial [Paracoccaceae bacterium]
MANGIRLAGLAMTKSNTVTTVVGNYVDNCFLEWTNELDPTPDFTSGFGFSALSVSDNVFLSGDVADWFAYLVIKSFGSGHGISNLTVNGNTFHSISGNIDRVERIDSS